MLALALALALKDGLIETDGEILALVLTEGEIEALALTLSLTDGEIL